jgi:integrase
VASVWHITRRTRDGAKRYVVRFYVSREPGSRIHHGGSFRLLREAEARERWIGGEIAAGRFPDVRRAMREEEARSGLTVKAAADRWLASRVDWRPNTRRSAEGSVQRLAPLFARGVHELAVDDLQAFIASLVAEGLAPGSIGKIKGRLAEVLDHAGVDPNPARDRRLKVPRDERAIPAPPPARHFATILAHTAERLRLPLRVLEATGMRAEELRSLAWGDVDVADQRWRIVSGKTRASRRWVQVPADLFGEVLDLVAPEDRTAERRVFQGLKESSLRNAMADACREAGIPLYSPHDLRHRRLSIWHREGVPLREIASRAGHTRTSLTLDTYTHVLLDEGALE